MVRSVLARLAATSMLMLPIAIPPGAQAEVPLPTGSYLDSCKVVSFDQATGELAANCQGKPVGMFGLATPDTSRMNVQGCKEGTIWNDNRQLYCITDSAWGNDRVIPQGSYISTCTDRKVVGGALLVAVCGAPGGSSRNASLDLRNCVWAGDISNYNGSLTCQRPPLTSATTLGRAIDSEKDSDVVKPALIEPGMVKPVMIAPIVPVEPSAAESEEVGKKKKRRRDRGERG